MNPQDAVAERQRRLRFLSARQGEGDAGRYLAFLLARRVRSDASGHNAVDLRRIRRVSRGRVVPSGAGDSRSTSCSRARKASLAISVWDIWTVVRGGFMNRAQRTSSKPTTDNSWGRAMPRSKASRITPMAVISFEHRIAVGGLGRSSSVERARIPPSIV